MATYINPSPGVSGTEVVLTISVANNAGDNGVTVPSIQNITLNANQDVMTWSQLDSTAKINVTTTSTNGLDMNIVLDTDTFFGDTGAAEGTAANIGLFALSNNKTKVAFELFFGKDSDGTATKTISGVGYLTGLSPTLSGDSPVWVSPISITVDGEYTIA